ncbi:unnamed protein product, partial [Ixodes pacificus]
MMMVLMVVLDRGTGSDVGRRRFAGSRGLRLVGGVVTNPVPPLDGHQVAALVEDDSPVAHHALLEGAHDLAAVVRDPVAAVEAHLAVVGPVPVAHQETRRVELGEAVVSLVARDLAQHAARDVALVLPACYEEEKSATQIRFSHFLEIGRQVDITSLLVSHPQKIGRSYLL